MGAGKSCPGGISGGLDGGISTGSLPGPGIGSGVGGRHAWRFVRPLRLSGKRRPCRLGVTDSRGSAAGCWDRCRDPAWRAPKLTPLADVPRGKPRQGARVPLEGGSSPIGGRCCGSAFADLLLGRSRRRLGGWICHPRCLEAFGLWASLAAASLRMISRAALVVASPLASECDGFGLKSPVWASTS